MSKSGGEPTYTPEDLDRLEEEREGELTVAERVEHKISKRDGSGSPSGGPTPSS